MDRAVAQSALERLVAFIRWNEICRPVEAGVFLLAPVIVTVWMILHAHNPAIDFHYAYWVAGWRLIHGTSVYAWRGSQIGSGMAFTYPALSAIAFVPFALISRGPSELLYTGICLISAVGALRVLGVRDWRLYGLLFVLSPVVAAWNTANLTLPLCLGLALVWRYRDHPFTAGCLTAVLISLKVFVWPLALWLLVTRRYRASLHMLLVGVALNLLAWGTLGFSDLSAFWHLSDALTKVQYRGGYGVLALAAHVGASYRTGEVLDIVLSAAIACVMWTNFRRDDQSSLAACVALMLVASPLVWSHYLALLIVPMAIAYPTLNPKWLLLLVFWVGPISDGVTDWQLAVVWATAGAVLLSAIPAAAHRPDRPSLRREARLPDARPRVSV
jgi:hypothetical protein